MEHNGHGDLHNHHSRISAQTPEELAALLEYAFHHNSSHIDELQQIAKKFEENGNQAACDKINAAAEEFRKGSLLLKEVTELIKQRKAK